MAVPQRSNTARLVAVVVGLGIAAAGLIGTLYLSHQSSTSNNNQPDRTVVVASQDIPQGVQITKDMLSTEAEPGNLVPAAALADPALVAGQYSALPISQNQIIVPGLLAPSAASPARLTAPLKIADGFVAMAIPDDSQKGAGGYIQPGDHIDILVDLDGNGTMKYLLQDVGVLRVGTPATAAGGGGNVDLLLIQLPRRQAEELGSVLSGSQSNKTVIVRYVLRPSNSYNKGYLSSGSDAPTTQPISDAPFPNSQIGAVFGH
jgi:Flp pilus assembly protein CpaB